MGRSRQELLHLSGVPLMSRQNLDVTVASKLFGGPFNRQLGRPHPYLFTEVAEAHNRTPLERLFKDTEFGIPCHPWKSQEGSYNLLGCG